MPDTPMCAQQSKELGESPAGTAPSETEHWIVLQVQAAWGRKAWSSVELPDAVRRHVDDALAQVGRARLQLIRRSAAEDDGTLALFVGRSTPGRSVLHRYQLDRPEQILEVPLVERMVGEPDPEAVWDTPLLLVCVHGTRDRCCARWGAPLMRALAPHTSDHLWGSSHVGGHRFAPNLLALPTVEGSKRQG
ncbi:MAG: sucrase ferredoxin, partial [Myxococcota bacterium]